PADLYPNRGRGRAADRRPGLVQACRQYPAPAGRHRTAHRPQIGMNPLARRVLTDEERVDWLRLSRTPQVGPIPFFGLIARYGSAKATIEDLPKLAARAGRAKPAAIPAAGD